MTPEHLRRMLARRGYGWRVVAPTHITTPHLRTWVPSCFAVRGVPGQQGQEQEIFVATTYALEQVEGTSELAVRIDEACGDGQHHVACLCGKPLLRAVAGTGRGPGATHWYEYRTTLAGPASVPLDACPRCARPPGEETVREIDDGAGAEEHHDGQ